MNIESSKYKMKPNIIGRKEFFTAGRVSPLPPSGKQAENTGSALQTLET